MAFKVGLTNAAIVGSRIIFIFLGWCGIMVAYLAAYGSAENDAAPMLPLKTFGNELWDDGYFTASGALRNDSARDDGDQLVPSAVQISCNRDKMICSVATATNNTGFLNADLTNYDVDSWNDRQIVFNDNTPICVDQSFTIDRRAETYALIVRKKSIIPEYARNSPLHPCDNVKNKDIMLADGIQVSSQRAAEFERRNGLYFHLALIAANLAYITVIVWSWRRTRRTKTLLSSNGS